MLYFTDVQAVQLNTDLFSVSKSLRTYFHDIINRVHKNKKLCLNFVGESHKEENIYIYFKNIYNVSSQDETTK